MCLKPVVGSGCGVCPWPHGPGAGGAATVLAELSIGRQIDDC